MQEMIPVKQLISLCPFLCTLWSPWKSLLISGGGRRPIVPSLGQARRGLVPSVHKGGSEASLCLESEPWRWRGEGGVGTENVCLQSTPPHPPPTLHHVNALPVHWSSKSNLNQLLGDPLKTQPLSFSQKMTSPHPAYLLEQLRGLVQRAQAPGLCKEKPLKFLSHFPQTVFLSFCLELNSEIFE